MKYDEMIRHNDLMLDKLIDSYAKFKLIPFIGSGFSKNVENFPDWEVFNEKLSKKLGKEEYFLSKIFKNHLPSIGADYYSIKLFRDRHPKKDLQLYKHNLKSILQHAIEEILDKDIQNKKSDLHKLLIDKFDYIFTTNWDRLLEVNKNGHSIKIVSDITHISDIHEYIQNNGEKIIVKMHGTLEEADNIVASETDYLELVNNNSNPLNIKYQNELFHYDFLFMGFSFQDLNIKSLTYPTYVIKKDKFGKDQAPKIFMIAFSGFDPIIADLYDQLFGIEVIFMDVAETDITDSTMKFLESVINNDKDIITSQYSTYKQNLKTELTDKKNKIEKEIEICQTTVGNATYAILHEKFNKRIAKLKYQNKLLEEKINTL